MKNIKFRAWDKLCKKMREVISIEMKPKENYIVMQYTGTNDIRGKEIYEGDIVQVNGAKYVVIYDENKMSFMLLGYTRGGLLAWTSNNYNDTELLGNIFENPKLFSKDEKLIEKVIDMICEVM